MKSSKLPPCTECKNENKLFCGLNNADRAFLSVNKGSNSYKSGQHVFYEGNHPNGLYCIYKGKVKLSKLGADGKEQIIRFAGEGEVIGYRALLSDTPYNATATAIENCEICHLSPGSFKEKLTEKSKLALNVIKALSDDLKQSEDNLVFISQKSVKERVAQALLMLKTRFGVEKDGATLAVVLTRREIGEIVNITTETVIRTLSEMKKEKILELDKHKIKITNLDRLVKLAKVEV